MSELIIRPKWYEHIDDIRAGKMPVRMLCLNNPFCELMTRGKTLETRFRESRVRGIVMFLSCKKPLDWNAVALIAGERQSARIWQALQGVQYRNGFALSMGELVGSRRMSPGDEDSAFVNHNSLRWCWEIADAVNIDPIAVKGHQGWRFARREVLEKIKLQIKKP